MIVIKFLGGLGNQLFQWAYGQALEARGYEVGYDKSALIPQTHREYSLAEYADLRFVTGDDDYVTYEYNLKFNVSNLYPADGNMMIGYWQTEKYFAEIANKIRSNFIFNWSIKPLTGVADAINKRIYFSKSVAIHVRRQDYLVLQDFHGMPGKDYYDRAIQHIQDRVQYPEFFVFSDDREWCRLNFPADFHIVDGTNKYEDLRLMSSCKHSILANSSFGWWGSWIGDNQLGRIVIAPKKWFVTPSMDDTDVMPERWLRL